MIVRTERAARMSLLPYPGRADVPSAPRRTREIVRAACSRRTEPSALPAITSFLIRT